MNSNTNQAMLAGFYTGNVVEQGGNVAVDSAAGPWVGTGLRSDNRFLVVALYNKTWTKDAGYSHPLLGFLIWDWSLEQK